MSRILIVEDEPAILAGLKANLEFDSHFVVTASDGERGYSLIRESSPDLVILDVMLPKLGGYELCRRVRGEGFNAPILILSARAAEGDRVLGLDLGATDYVTKPFSLRELLARVRALLRYAHDNRSEQGRLEEEIKTAFEVQQRLLPHVCPAVEGLDYAGLCRPALGVSGDYYDFIPLGSGKLGLLLADVSGKGMPAALLGASLHAAVRAYAPLAGENCGELISRINSLLYESTAAERFATIFYGVYNSTRRTLTYANAGHCPPLLFKCKTTPPQNFGSHAHRQPDFHVRGCELSRPSDRQCSRLESLTPPVGMFPSLPMKQRTIDFAPGSWLVIVSDGIPEACNEGGEEFGEHRLAEATRSAANITAAQFCARVLDEVKNYTAGCPQTDDLTLIAARST